MDTIKCTVEVTDWRDVPWDARQTRANILKQIEIDMETAAIRIADAHGIAIRVRAKHD